MMSAQSPWDVGAGAGFCAFDETQVQMQVQALGLDSPRKSVTPSAESQRDLRAGAGYCAVDGSDSPRKAAMPFWRPHQSSELSWKEPQIPVGIAALASPKPGLFSAPLTVYNSPPPGTRSPQPSLSPARKKVHHKIVGSPSEEPATTPSTGSPSSSRLSSDGLSPKVPFRDCAWDTSVTDMRKGCLVDVANHTFVISRELGRGNFGIVYEAHMHDAPGSADVAIKVSTINTDNASYGVEAQAVQLRTECRVLQQLTAKLASQSSPHSPQYLAHAVTSSKVTLAMTKVPGLPLGKWLYGTDAGELCTRTPNEYFEGRLPAGLGSHTLSTSFGGACHLTATLLSQLSPVFSALQDIAFHRDISAQNLMLDDSGGRLDFGLIDLGLAIDTPRWLQGWRTEDVGGDPRYWSPAHWVKGFFGVDCLELEQPALAYLFRERLDHYSFGIVALELLFGLWRGPSGEPPAAPGAWQAMVQARAQWRSYWRLALMIREVFMRNVGDSVVLRREMVDSGLLASFSAAHDALRTALHVASATGPSFQAPLLLALANLIDPTSRLSWDEVSQLASRC